MEEHGELVLFKFFYETGMGMYLYSLQRKFELQNKLQFTLIAISIVAVNIDF